MQQNPPLPQTLQTALRCAHDKPTPVQRCILMLIDKSALQYTFSTIPQVVSSVYALTAAFALSKLNTITDEEKMIKIGRAPFHKRALIALHQINGGIPEDDDHQLDPDEPLPEVIHNYALLNDIPLNTIDDIITCCGHRLREIVKSERQIKRAFKSLSLWFLASFFINIISIIFSSEIGHGFWIKMWVIALNLVMLAIVAFLQW